MVFQVAALLAGEVLIKYRLFDTCKATGYRAVRGTVVSCLMVSTQTTADV